MCVNNKWKIKNSQEKEMKWDEKNLWKEKKNNLKKKVLKIKISQQRESDQVTQFFFYTPAEVDFIKKKLKNELKNNDGDDDDESSKGYFKFFDIKWKKNNFSKNFMEFYNKFQPTFEQFFSTQEK